MSRRYELRFSGAGGQGLITAGIILAEAAAIIENQYAVQSQSYGPEARGGASKSEVIVSDGPIDYPKATLVDACLALTQEAAERYSDSIKSGGLLLVDEDFVKAPPQGDFKVVRLPIINTAKNDLGRAIVANVVALGAMVALTGVVRRESGEEAVLRKVPPAFANLNKKAYNAGYDRGKTLLG